MKVVDAFDTTPFVRISIEEVVRTLLEAMVLVFLVMYLFLQNFRATLIPTIAVPVVLLGTFGVLAAFGYSINTLTMFAMVLAIGLLVDDAIVVVENVERIMHEDGLSAQGRHPPVHDPDLRGPGGHRPGPLGRVRAHGLLRRLHGRHLPPVLHYRGLGHGPVRPGGPRADSGPVRHHAEARQAREHGRRKASSAGSTASSNAPANGPTRGLVG